MYAEVPLKGISNTVSRTTALKVVEDLKDALSIEPDAYVALENMFTNNTYTSGINVPVDKSTLDRPNIERVSVAITEDSMSEYAVSMGYDKTNPLFKNPHVSIGTKMIPMSMKLEISYETKSSVNADELLNYLRDHLVRKGGGYVHMVDSYYLIPQSVLGLLEDTYTTAGINIPNDRTFLEYVLIDGNIVKAITLKSNINGEGNNAGLAALLQTKIHGSFETSIRDIKSELDKDKNEYAVVLSYKLEYMRPETLTLDYEILVNNSFLPSKYYKEEYITDIDAKRYRDEIWNDRYTIMEVKQNYVSIPPFDNYRPMAQTTMSMKPVLSALTKIDKTDLRNLLILDRLHYYEFNDIIRDYLHTNRESLLDDLRGGYDSIFILDLYEGSYLMDRGTLTIDDDMLVSSTVDLDISKVYRVILSIIVDSNLLSVKGKNSIKDLDDEMLSELLTSVNADSDGLSTPGSTETIAKDHRVVDSDLPRYMIPFSAHTRYTAQVTTVETFFKPIEEK